MRVNAMRRLWSYDFESPKPALSAEHRRSVGLVLRTPAAEPIMCDSTHRRVGETYAIPLFDVQN